MSAQVHFVSADDATYADLEAAPAGYTVDLIGGRLIHWELNRVVTVPELAGWRKEPMPDMPDDPRFTGAPDWLGEILSPTTRDYDLNEKFPLYPPPRRPVAARQGARPCERAEGFPEARDTVNRIKPHEVRDRKAFRS